jgi:tartrate/fumarate subfamily iron-sulfur-dependent hydro-lyase alpha chain
MISRKKIEEVGYDLVKKLPHSVPSDVSKAIQEAFRKEADALPKEHLISLLDNLHLAKKMGISTCGDTGYPTFLLRIGNIELEGGIPTTERTLTSIVQRVTDEGGLRPSVLPPFVNQPTNVGRFVPQFDYLFDDKIDYLELTAALFGGASELWGSAYRTMMNTDGIKGVKKFVIDSVIENGRMGAACPPNIVGVGIGGTAAQAMRLAKLASMLRPVGVRNPEETYAKLELELLDGINALGLGSMGTGGSITALDVHIEYAHTHLAGLPTAISMQCPATRLITAKISRDGNYEITERPDWRSWLKR